MSLPRSIKYRLLVLLLAGFGLDAAAQPAGAARVAQSPPATVALTSTVAPAEVRMLDAYATLVTTVDTRALPACPPLAGERQPLDIALVIDRSSSMEGPNIAAARTAAQAFVRDIDTAQDQVGVVVFDSAATQLLALTRDQPALLAAIGQIQTDGNTDIGGGIAFGQRLLEGGGANPQARRILILLSDGDSDAAAAVAAADNAKLAGIRIITIGLGGSNNGLLRQIASSAGDFSAAPDPAQLATIYSGIAQNIQQGVVARDVTITQSLPTWSVAGLDREALAGNATVNALGDTIVWRYPSLGPESLALAMRFRGLLPGTTDANAGVTVTYRDCADALQTFRLAPGAPLRISLRLIWWCLLPLLLPLALLLLLVRRRTRRLIRGEGARIPQVAGIPALNLPIQAGPDRSAAIGHGLPPTVQRQPAIVVGIGEAGDAVIGQINEVTGL